VTHHGGPTLSSTFLLAKTMARAAQNDPLFFWRPHEEHGYLGQWWSSPFTAASPIDSTTQLRFKNCESYMMYHKAILFNDAKVADEIFDAADDPKQVKALGRLVKGFDQATWDASKYDIVVQANRYKFSQNLDLRTRLLETEGRELVEASPMDRIWGVGYAKGKALQNRARWGQNLLGKALMQVRDEIIAEDTASIES